MITTPGLSRTLGDLWAFPFSPLSTRQNALKFPRLGFSSSVQSLTHWRPFSARSGRPLCDVRGDTSKTFFVPLSNASENKGITFSNLFVFLRGKNKGITFANLLLFFIPIFRPKRRQISRADFSPVFDNWFWTCF